MTTHAQVVSRTPFAHGAERLLARVLDYYGVRWEYEPRTFPLRWDADGRVLEAFTPDFHLPDLRLYLEVTVQRQTLVTRKNRKLRLMAERYPDVRVKMLYRRDMERLALRFALPLEK